MGGCPCKDYDCSLATTSSAMTTTTASTSTTSTTTLLTTTTTLFNPVYKWDTGIIFNDRQAGPLLLISSDGWFNEFI